MKIIIVIFITVVSSSSGGGGRTSRGIPRQLLFIGIEIIMKYKNDGAGLSYVMIVLRSLWPVQVEQQNTNLKLSAGQETFIVSHCISIYIIAVDTPWPGPCGETWSLSGSPRTTSSSLPVLTAIQVSFMWNGLSLNRLVIMIQVG